VPEAPPAISEAPGEVPSPLSKLNLTAGQLLGDAAREAIVFGSGALERYRAAAGVGETEPIHQLRVTARRLRASLQLFGRVIHAAYVRTIERDLAWMAQAAGGAREPEITAGIFRSRAGKLDPALAASLETIHTTLSRERSEKLKQLSKVVESKRYRRILERLEHPRLRRVDADSLLAQRAASMLRPIARAVGRAGTDLDQSSAPITIHRLRVRVKRLRYAIEMLSGLGGKRCRKLLVRLEGLQELLGDLNDLSVAGGWLIKFAKTESAAPDAVMAAGAMSQLLRKRSDKLARRSVKAWRKLEKCGAITDAINEIRRSGKQMQPVTIAVQQTTTVNAA
jgi:CHAD domain-containing protein